MPESPDTIDEEAFPFAPRWPSETSVPIHVMNTFAIAYNDSTEEFELTVGHYPATFAQIEDHEAPRSGVVDVLGRFVMTTAVMASLAQGLGRVVAVHGDSEDSDG